MPKDDVFSTSGVVLKIGEHSLNHWSTSQATISLSSTEAEAKAITKGHVEGIYSRNLLEALPGEASKLWIWTDSSSARATSRRLLGTGVEAPTMSKQDIMTVHRVASDEHEADVPTKHVTRAFLGQVE